MAFTLSLLLALIILGACVNYKKKVELSNDENLIEEPIIDIETPNEERVSIYNITKYVGVKGDVSAYQTPERTNLTPVLIKSLDEYNELKAQEEILSEFTLAIDADYFKEKQLIIFSTRDILSPVRRVAKLEIKDNVLVVHVHFSSFHNYMYEPISGAYWTYYVMEVKINDIENIVSIKIEKDINSGLPIYEKRDIPFIRDCKSNYGRSPEDLKELDNLKDISIYYSQIVVDFVFENHLSDEALKRLVEILESSPNIEYVGYKGNDFVRLVLKNSYYDKRIAGTLTASDIIDSEHVLEYGITIEFLTFIPFVHITFYLENVGKAHADIMKEEIKKIYYRYIVVPEEVRLEFNVAMDYHNFIKAEEYPEVVIVTSLEQFEEICNERYAYFADKEFYYIKVNTPTYDEDFFKDKVLLVYTKNIRGYYNTLITGFKINSVIRQDQTLIIELNKGDVEGITNVETRGYCIINC
jgi:hypothetical protein